MRINFIRNHWSKAEEPKLSFFFSLLFSLSSFPRSPISFLLAATTDQLTIHSSILLAKQQDKSLHKLEHRSHYESTPAAGKCQSYVSNCRTKKSTLFSSVSHISVGTVVHQRKAREGKIKEKFYRDLHWSSTKASHGKKTTTFGQESRLTQTALTLFFFATC